VLDYNVDAFWLVMRVLACGGLAVVVWEASTNQLAKKTNIEVSLDMQISCAVVLIPVVVGTGHVVSAGINAASMLVRCAPQAIVHPVSVLLDQIPRLSNIRVSFSVVLFTQFSSVLVQSVLNPVSVMRTLSQQ